MAHINPLNAELNPICHLLALLGGATIVVVSRLRVKDGNLCSILEQSVRNWCWSVSRWFCPDITMLPTFHTHHPRLESLVLWSHLKPHPLYLQWRPSPCVSFLFKQASKMSASCSTFAVRKLDSAAVCFVTLHVLNSTRPLSLSNVTTLFLLDFIFKWPCIFD